LCIQVSILNKSESHHKVRAESFNGNIMFTWMNRLQDQ
jgi:hypothetical protein